MGGSNGENPCVARKVITESSSSASATVPLSTVETDNAITLNRGKIEATTGPIGPATWISYSNTTAPCLGDGRWGCRRVCGILAELPDAAQLDTQALQAIEHADQFGLVDNRSLQHRLQGLR